MIKKFLEHKSILILGFGKEGISSYHFIRRHFPQKRISIADQDRDHQAALALSKKDQAIEILLGANYLDSLNEFDVILKSPGIFLEDEHIKVYSQSSLFLKYYGEQTIGVTGTKGKSTSSSLIYHILKSANRPSLLVGNIGQPPFDIIEDISSETIIVFELSSHQLIDIKDSCRIGIYLNIYPEHLDYYPNFSTYAFAKANIFKYQNKKGIQIINQDQAEIKNYIKDFLKYGRNFSFSNQKKADCYLNNDKILLHKEGNDIEILKTSEIKNIIGAHNFLNIMAAIIACDKFNVALEDIRKGVLTFKSLEHRLEYVGCYENIYFYNDSISTIPEASIMAIKALPKTRTLILGGFDRGLNYDKLFAFLPSTKIKNIIFMGPAGLRMMKEYPQDMEDQKWVFAKDMKEAVCFVKKLSMTGSICLLSPAAASYDQFKNFEERGKSYKKQASE